MSAMASRFSTLAFTMAQLFAIAQCKAAEPLRLEVKFVPQSALVGEPIIAECTLINDGPDSLTIRLPGIRDDWLAMTSARSAGEPAKLHPQVPAPPVASLFSTKVLKPGERTMWKFVISRQMPTLRPGEYTTTVSAALQVERGDRPDALEVLRPEATVPFKVTRQDIQRLRTLAADLGQRALSERGTAGEFAVQQLFSMPEKVALPVWRDLIGSDEFDSSSSSASVVAELQRLATSASIQLLYEMWREDKPRGRAAVARQALRDLLFSLKGQSASNVRRMFVAMEGQVPVRSSLKPYDP